MKNIKICKLKTIIWIHDYHLMLLPKLIRTSIMGLNLPNTIIAFFLHIPFPPFDIFRTLIEAFEILDGMLGADLIGY